LNVGAFVWGVILFVPLSGIGAAVYLALALGRRGSVPIAPAVPRSGAPAGVRVALVVAGSILAIFVLVSLATLIGAGGR
jgi:hypothetical protein